MINVLFISKRWINHKNIPNSTWITDVYHDWFYSYNSTGLGAYKVFEFDYQLELGIDPNKSLIELCKHSKFDVIIFASYYLSDYKFEDEVWDYLKKELNIPIVFIFQDTYLDDLPYRKKDDHSHCKYADYIIHCDTDLYIGKGLTDSPPKVFFPQHSPVFYDEELVRDIPVLLNCSHHTVDRQALLKHLASVGIDVTVRGGRLASNNESVTHYSLNYMRAKLSITASHHFNTHHVIAHTPESIMCGACTFVNKSDVFSKYFKPGIEYVEYDDFFDLADKIIYYTDNEDEAREIGKNGVKAISRFNAYSFYNNMFATLKTINPKFKYNGELID